jgi:hypothetical protein
MNPPEEPIDWTSRAQPLGQQDAPVPPTDQSPAAAPYIPAGYRPPPRRPRTGLILATLICVAVLIIALGGTVIILATRGGSAKPAAATSAVPSNLAIMLLTFTLADSSGVLNEDDVHCSGMSGYSDITAGAQVTVTDERGTVIGAGVLPEGTLIGSGAIRKCQYKVTITDLPRGRQFYGVTIGHRGTTQFTEGQLSNVDLELG